MPACVPIRPSRELQDRLLDKVKLDPVRRCWLFTGRTIPSRHNVVGYGQIGVGNGKTTVTHRVSYELFCGPIPDGQMVLHRCDTRNCVAPHHLFLGTMKDNMRDAMTKRRHSHGERHHNAILEESQVLEIRRQLVAGVPNATIARQFGVRINLIQNLRNGKAWTHLPPLNLPRLRRKPVRVDENDRARARLRTKPRTEPGLRQPLGIPAESHRTPGHSDTGSSPVTRTDIRTSG